jgi:hypothetical protein
VNFLSIIEEFQEIILATETIEFVNEENISRLKLKIKFIDSTYLSVRELNSKFNALYSYYWLREDHSVIIGWDNAPHHKNIDIINIRIIKLKLQVK